MCIKCGAKKELEGHHIIRWADNEKLRYVISNIVTLCKSCHEFCTGREDEFREEFQRAVALRTDKDKIDKRMQKALSIKHNYKPKNPYLRY